MEWDGSTESESDYQKRYADMWYVMFGYTPQEREQRIERIWEKIRNDMDAYDKAADEAEIQKLLRDTLGAGTYMVGEK